MGMSEEKLLKLFGKIEAGTIGTNKEKIVTEAELKEMKKEDQQKKTGGKLLWQKLRK